jgi:hypothetical protein
MRYEIGCFRSQVGNFVTKIHIVKGGNAICGCVMSGFMKIADEVNDETLKLVGCQRCKKKWRPTTSHVQEEEDDAERVMKFLRKHRLIP